MIRKLKIYFICNIHKVQLLSLLCIHGFIIKYMSLSKTMYDNVVRFDQ